MFLSTPPNTLDVSFRVSHAESSYMVYASTETMQCFECGDIGHKRFYCPHKAEGEGPSDKPQIVTKLHHNNLKRLTSTGKPTCF